MSVQLKLFSFLLLTLQIASLVVISYADFIILLNGMSPKKNGCKKATLESLLYPGRFDGSESTYACIGSN